MIWKIWEEAQAEDAHIHRHFYKTRLDYRVMFWLLRVLRVGMFFGFPSMFCHLSWMMWQGREAELPWDYLLTWGWSFILWIGLFIYLPAQQRWIARSIACRQTESLPGIEGTSDFLEFCLRLFLSRATCKALLGDLDEGYALDCERFGRRRAQFLYACDLTRSLWPVLVSGVRKLVGWSAFASAIEWVRRHI